MTISRFSVVVHYSASPLLVKMKNSCQNTKNSYQGPLESKETQIVVEGQNLKKWQVMNVLNFFLAAFPQGWDAVQQVQSDWQLIDIPIFLIRGSRTRSSYDLGIRDHIRLCECPTGSSGSMYGTDPNERNDLRSEPPLRKGERGLAANVHRVVC